MLVWEFVAFNGLKKIICGLNLGEIARFGLIGIGQQKCLRSSDFILL